MNKRGSGRGSAIVVLSALCVMGVTRIALAQEGVIITGSVRDDPKPTDPRYIVCYTWDRESGVVYVTSGIAEITYAQSELDNDWRDHLAKNYKLSSDLWGGCNTEKTLKDAQWRLGDFNTPDPNHPHPRVQVDWTPHFKTGGAAQKHTASGGHPARPPRPDPAAAKAAAKAAAEAAAAARRETLQLAAVMKEMGLPPGREEDAKELLRKRKEAGLPMPDVPEDKAPEPKNCRSVATKLDGWTLEGRGKSKAAALANAKKIGPTHCTTFDPKLGPIAIPGVVDRNSCRPILGGEFFCSWHFTCKGPATETDCSTPGPPKGTVQ